MALTRDRLTTEVVLAVTVGGALTLFAMYWYQKRRKQSFPTNWQAVGKIKSLFMYPLKSGRRHELKTAICTEYGFQIPDESGSIYQFRDRNFLIYNQEKSECIDFQSNPKLILIETNVCGKHHFTLDAPGMTTLKVEIPGTNGNNDRAAIKLWTSETLYAIDCGDEAAKWLSKYIWQKDSGLRLGFHDGCHRREVKDAFKKYLSLYPNLRNEASGMYSNFSSYLLINQASVDDLSSRIPNSTITANNFRPNILVEGADSYKEDNWKWIKIGDVVFYSVRPCTRCTVTTINPETGVKSKNYEPLRTLRQYRQLKELTNVDLDGYRTVMGNEIGLHTGGQISVNDVVYVGIP